MFQPLLDCLPLRSYEHQKAQITVRYVDIANNNLLNPQTVELFPEQQTVYTENIEDYNVDVQNKQYT